MVLVIMLLAPVALLCAEIYVIVLVAGLIGVLWTFLALAAGFALGGMLLRSQGRASWRRFVQATASGELAHREVLDGALLIVAGLALAFPGFLTDVAALFLMLGPTRALSRRLLLWVASRRLGIVRAAANRTRRFTMGPDDVEGTATEHPDNPARHLHR